jgi:hypothetical protein
MNRIGMHNTMNRLNQNANQDKTIMDRRMIQKEIHKELIKYIYTTIDISKYKFEIFKYDNQLNKLISNKHYVSANYNGKNCFLVFTKLKSKYYSFFVDRRKLSYTFDKIKMEEVFVNHCNADVDLSIYSGTIFDGCLINNNNNINNNGLNKYNLQSQEFIITDVYYFKGSDYTEGNLKHKLYEIQMYLDNIGGQIKYDKEKVNNKISLDLKVNKLYDVTDIRSLLSDIDKNNKLRANGICFYPEISGTKLIHLFDNNNMNNNINNITNNANNNVNNANNNVNNNSGSNETKHRANQKDNITVDSDELNRRVKSLIKKVYTSKSDKPIYAILEMKSTKTADNYKLFAVEEIKVDGVTKLKKCQMDIAYIPDMKCSLWCRKITTETPNGSVFVKCIWREDKKKWEPIEVKENARLPTTMEEIRKNLVEIEQSESESDDD